MAALQVYLRPQNIGIRAVSGLQLQQVVYVLARPSVLADVVEVYGRYVQSLDVDGVPCQKTLQDQ